MDFSGCLYFQDKESFVRLFTLIIVCLLSVTGFPLLASGQGIMEDVVYLKDGSIIRGLIAEQVPGKSVKIHTRAGNVFIFKMEEIDKIAKEPLMQVRVPSMQVKVGQKNPTVAFVLSFIIVGGGQFYNEQYDKGMLMFLGGMVSTLVFFNTVDDDYTNAYGDLIDPNNDDMIGFFGCLIGGSLWLWSLIDAVYAAKQINLQNQPYTSHLEVNPMVSPDRSGAVIAVRW